MLKTVWWTEGLVNKLSVFVKGPGWAPGKPRLGCAEDIPNVSILSVSISTQTFIDINFVCFEIYFWYSQEGSTMDIISLGQYLDHGGVLCPLPPEKLRPDGGVAM